MDPGPTAEEIAAATAAAATKRTAIETEAAVAAADDEGLGGTGAPTDAQVAGEYNVNIKYDETSITVEGTTADDNETFMQAMDFEDGRTMHTRTMDADADGNVVSEVVIVSTDIAAPTAVPFAMFELADGTTPQALNARDLDDAVDADNDGTATNDWTALNVVAANIAQIMSGGFSSSGSGTLNYANDDASTDNMDEAFETAGTYNGASGTYRCNGTSACSITYDAMGMITSVAGDWVFTPDAGATSDQPDYDYLHYGFWLQRTTDSDDAVTYNEVQTFAGSSIAGSGSTTSVRGSATYSGGAVGVYVREAYKETDGSIDTATSGHFIANVALTATFGQVHAGDDPSDTSQPGTIAPNMLNTLTGTINNFMLSNGEA
ncbi:MAG: hypothetical protein F4X93_03450, partial [Proteobacteria bacterium]|nr:hypothetical protein [Pseudomonadota bacterium]